MEEYLIMKKSYSIYALLLVYGFSIIAMEPTQESNTSAQLDETFTEVSIENENYADEYAYDNEEIEAPRKPTIGDSWGKVVRFKWTSLNRDDAWNIGKSITGAALISGASYYVYSRLNVPHNPGPNNQNNHNPPFFPDSPSPVGGNNHRTVHNEFGDFTPDEWQQQQDLFQRYTQEAQERREREQERKRIKETRKQNQDLFSRFRERVDELEKQYQEELARVLEESRLEAERNNKNNTTNTNTTSNTTSTTDTTTTIPDVSDNATPDATTVKTIECSVCLDDKNPADCYTMDCCDEKFCKECLIEQLNACLDSNSTAEVKCSNRNCAKKIEEPALRAMTRDNKALYDRYMEIAFVESLDQDPNVKQCKTVNCNNRFVVDPQVQRHITTCRGCKQKYCSHCGINHMMDITCDQAQRDKELAENPDLARQENEKWLRANTKQCPGCRNGIQKNMGCNHMTCKKCGHQFCWTCLGVYGTGICTSAGCGRKNVRTGYDF
jgi:hypothetical protein